MAHSNTLDLPTDAYGSGNSAAPSFSPNKKLAISAAAVLLTGGGIWLTQKIKTYNQTHNPDGPDAQTPTAEGGKTGESALHLRGHVDTDTHGLDNLSFEEAFRHARHEVGMGSVFTWHGKLYSTFEQEEWRSLSLAQRQEFIEAITHDDMPVQTTTTQTPTSLVAGTTLPPRLIEGYLNGQHVMGVDVDHDGVIDSLVIAGADGNTYRVMDTSGDDGLDAIYRFDSLTGEMTAYLQLEHSVILTDDQFSQGLEESMAQEVVQSILDEENNDNNMPTQTPTPQTGTPASPTQPLADITNDAQAENVVADDVEAEVDQDNKADEAALDDDTTYIAYHDPAEPSAQDHFTADADDE